VFHIVKRLIYLLTILALIMIWGCGCLRGMFDIVDGWCIVSSSY
jgi:hypothetical protein